MTKHPPDGRAALFDALAGLTPRALTIVSGAGISAEHPSHVPLGEPLMKQAMAGFFVSGLLDEIRAAYRAMPRWPGHRARYAGRPRLEVVLDVLQATQGASALRRLSANFRGREPNRLHRMMAAHILAGGRHVTANFDLLIEACEGRVLPTPPHHFHGHVGVKVASLPFGSTIRRIEPGFDARARSHFLASLRRDDCRAIAFIGYSFSDYFDATPALVASIRAGDLDGRVIAWFDWDPDERSVDRITRASASLPAAIRALVERGSPVFRVVGIAGDELFAVLQHLGCALAPEWAAPAACGCALAAFAPRIDASPDDRKRSSLQLLARLELLGRLPVDAGSAPLGLSVADLSGAQRSDYFWKKGLYRRGLAAELEGLHLTSPMRPVREHLSRAKYAWIRGQYRVAGAHTLAALDAIDHEPSAPPDLRALALERFARVAVHMRRVPDARRLLLPRLLRARPGFHDEAQTFADEAASVSPTLKVHLRDAISVFEREVLGAPELEAPGAITLTRSELIARLDQLEALGSFVDFLRGNGNLGRWPVRLTPGHPWQEAMATLYRAVGNEADIHRMELQSLGSEWNAGLVGATRAALRLDITWWHRIRMVVQYALKAIAQGARR